MINSIKKILPATFKMKVKNKLMGFTSDLFKSNKISFSQSGEDIIIKNYFNDKRDGFFVDVGAFHPFVLSNTYFFYLLRNWNGLNIDARPGSMELFDKLRPNDINIEHAVSNKKEVLNYYFISEISPMNSFSEEFLKQNNAFDKVTKTIPVKADTLEVILDKYLPKGKSIDFMNVDVEGMDLLVLESNNWSKYRPKVVLNEVSIDKFADFETNPVYQFMLSIGYEVLSMNYSGVGLYNVFFVDKTD